MDRKKITKLFLKLLVSGILIVSLFKQTNIQTVKEVWMNLNWWVLAFSLVSYCLAVIAGGFKWRIFLADCKISILVRCCFKAQFYATVLPGQLFGEASKIVSLNRTNIDRGVVAASVIADKLAGLIGLVLVGIGGIIGTTIEIPALLRGGFIFFLFLFLVICLFPRCRFFNVLVLRLIHYFWRNTRGRKHRFIRTIYKLYSTWRHYAKQQGLLVRAIVWGAVIQMMGVIQIWGISRMIGVTVPLVEFMWILAALSLILLLPISFAGLGVREISLAGFLLLFKVSSDISVVISILLLCAQLGAAICGALCVVYDQVNGIKNVKEDTNENIH